MTRPLALDLFCGAGGVSMGLWRAGFQVVGVDIEFQKRYPFAFLKADALRPPFDLGRFDFIWASPPCQAHTALKKMHNAKRHADLIPATRAMLKASGVPYAIENVEGAPLLDPVKLCGSMFGLGYQGHLLRRHRLIECSFSVRQPKCLHAGKPVIGVYGGHARNRSAKAGGRGTRDDWQHGHHCAASTAMGIDWMTLDEISQAIPPAYSEFIGREALAHISAFAEAAE